jgi:hypothetical protein
LSSDSTTELLLELGPLALEAARRCAPRADRRPRRCRSGLASTFRATPGHLGRDSTDHRLRRRHARRGRAGSRHALLDLGQQGGDLVAGVDRRRLAQQRRRAVEALRVGNS